MSKNHLYIFMKAARWLTYFFHPLNNVFRSQHRKSKQHDLHLKIRRLSNVNATTNPVAINYRGCHTQILRVTEYVDRIPGTQELNFLLKQLSAHIPCHVHDVEENWWFLDIQKTITVLRVKLHRQAK